MKKHAFLLAGALAGCFLALLSAAAVADEPVKPECQTKTLAQFEAWLDVQPGAEYAVSNDPAKVAAAIAETKLEYNSIRPELMGLLDGSDTVVAIRSNGQDLVAFFKAACAVSAPGRTLPLAFVLDGAPGKSASPASLRTPGDGGTLI